MKKCLFSLTITALLLSTCGGEQSAAPPTPEPSATSVPPTETPVPGPSPTPMPLPIEVLRDVPYVANGAPEQKLDIYRPKEQGGPFPTLFVIHGGGGSKSQMAVMGYYFAKRGYAVVSINHRQPPQHKYPVPVQDTFCALAWVHANADTYDLDPDHIVALGYSAGGTLAAMLGVADDGAVFVAGCPHPLPTGNWVQGVVTFTGIFDFMRGAERSTALREYLTTYLGVGPDEDPDTWSQASPSTWVDGSEPPFLLIHGLEDTGLSPEESKHFAAVLEQAGVDVELVLVPDANHGIIIRSEQLYQAVVAFCARIWGRP